MTDCILELDHITKSFGGEQVLKGISLSIRKGEFITLLGSSGCGKTTTLRIIAGLEEPDEGSVRLNGVDVTGLEPNKRNVNTVFQNYALFPHMDVYTNVAYGLKLKKLPKDEIKDKVLKALELVQLPGFGERMPAGLSGGQKQRVAIARAVVNNPQVLLLDEPLGALDLQLRRQMQTELKRLQKQLGITFVYITHDQEEALNMSDRIVVMKDGRFVQCGPPNEIYDRPETSYVARFVGTANIIGGHLESLEAQKARISTGFGMVCAQIRKEQLPGLTAGRPVTLAVRSEDIALHTSDAGSGMKLVVKEKNFAGGMLKISLDGGENGEIISSHHGFNSQINPGDTVYADWDAGQAVLVDLEGQDA